MPPKEKVARISLSLPPKLLERFDQVAEESGFHDRSKAVQAAMRSFISEQGQMEEASDTVNGALLVVYNHEVRGIDAALTDIEHQNRGVISSSFHMHIGENHCLKVVVVRGRVGEVRGLERSLRRLKGVMQLKPSLLKTELD